MATVRFSYSQSVDDLYRFVTDPEIVRQRSMALGERDVRVTKSGETLTNLRVVEAEVPGFAKKLFTPTNTVEDVKAWDAATKTARMTVDVRGAPTKISGTIRIVPNGTGADYVVDYQVACKIPLIGGKLEEFVSSATEKGLRQEYEHNKKMLGS
ncbi:MAG: DUF2505 domain-containing protein [Polyangiales bacterium]